MKIILSMIVILTSCKTNIVDHYDCSGKEELVSKTFISCVEASREKECPQKETKNITKNPIIACEDSSRSLICIPVYKEIKFK